MENRDPAASIYSSTRKLEFGSADALLREVAEQPLASDPTSLARAKMNALEAIANEREMGVYIVTRESDTREMLVFGTTKQVAAAIKDMGDKGFSGLEARLNPEGPLLKSGAQGPGDIFAAGRGGLLALSGFYRFDEDALWDDFGASREGDKTRRQPGSAAGRLVMKEDFDDPLPDDVMRGFEGG